MGGARPALRRFIAAAGGAFPFGLTLFAARSGPPSGANPIGWEVSTLLKVFKQSNRIPKGKDAHRWT